MHECVGWGWISCENGARDSNGLVYASPFLDNLFLMAYKNTLAERFSLRPSNSLDFCYCRHKTLRLLEPPPSAARVAPPRWRGTTLTL